MRFRAAALVATTALLLLVPSVAAGCGPTCVEDDGTVRVEQEGEEVVVYVEGVDPTRIGPVVDLWNPAYGTVRSLLADANVSQAVGADDPTDDEPDDDVHGQAQAGPGSGWDDDGEYTVSSSFEAGHPHVGRFTSNLTLNVPTEGPFRAGGASIELGNRTVGRLEVNTSSTYVLRVLSDKFDDFEVYGLAGPVWDEAERNDPFQLLLSVPVGLRVHVVPPTVCVGACTTTGGAAPDGVLPGARTTGTLDPVEPSRVEHTAPDGPTWPIESSSGSVRAGDPSGGGLPVLLVGAAVALAIVVLYRRLTREEILGHDLRSKILEIVREEPGINAEALARMLDVDPRTIRYHTGVLEDADHLVVKERGGQRMLLVADAGDDAVTREALLALRQAGKQEILRLLAAEPALNVSEIARRIGRHPSTVKRHADDLLSRGLLEETRDGAARCMRLRETVRDAVTPRS